MMDKHRKQGNTPGNEATDTINQCSQNYQKQDNAKTTKLQQMESIVQSSEKITEIILSEKNQRSCP